MAQPKSPRFENRAFNGLKELAQPDLVEWGRQLIRIRKMRDMSAAALARSVGVSPGVLEDWEAGRAAPSGSRLARLHGVLRAMKAFTHLIPRDQAERAENAAEAAEEDVRSNPPVPPRETWPVTPAPLPPAPTWNAILAAEMLKASTSARDLADLLGVHASTARNWTAGDTMPGAEHYRALVELFPALAAVPVDEASLAKSTRGPDKGPRVKPATSNLETLGAEHGRALQAVVNAKRTMVAAREALETAQLRFTEAKDAAADLAARLAAAAEET